MYDQFLKASQEFDKREFERGLEANKREREAKIASKEREVKRALEIKRQARLILYLALAFSTMIVVPLFISLWNPVHESYLALNLRKILLNQTIIAGHHVELIKTRVDWTKKPPEVDVIVQARESITPKQVRLVEEFVRQKMQQDFKLVFLVTLVEEVRSEDQHLSPVTLPEPTPTPYKVLYSKKESSRRYVHQPR